MKDLYVSALLDVYGFVLSEKQRTLTEYYYNDDLSLSEIAENEGITRQGVNDLIKRAVAQLNSLKLKELSAEVKNGNTEKNNEILDIIDNL